MRIGRVAQGHPVDVASGEQFTAAHDIAIPGHVPLIWRRYYSTALLDRPASSVGVGWVHFFDGTLVRDIDGYRFHGHDGIEVEFDGPESALVEGGSLLNRAHSMELRRERQHYVIYHWHDWATDVTLFTFPVSSNDRMLLDAVKVPSGHSLDLRYDEEHRLAEIRQTVEKRALQLDYKPDGLLGSVFLVAPNSTRELVATYEHDDERRLVVVRDAMGVPIRYEYDGDARLIAESGRDGGIYRMSYSASGQCSEVSGDRGYGLRRFKYDETARINEVSDSLGHSTVYHCNPSGQVETEIRPNGAVHRTQFDEHGRIVSKIDPLDHTTQYTHDEAGNVSAIQYPNGATTKFLYNRDHQPIEIAQSDGGTWTLQYERGALSCVRDPEGAETKYRYDPDNLLVASIAPTGNSVRFTWDSDWFEESSLDEYGPLISREYDARMNVVRLADARGTLRRFEYDSRGHMTSIIEADGAVRRLSCDSAGRLAKYTDANQHAVVVEYSAYSHYIRVSDALGRAYKYEWDTEGRLVAIRNPKGETATYEYDSVGNVITIVGFDGGISRFEFDTTGRCTQWRDPDGRAREYEYDAVGNVTRISCDDKNLTTNKYDSIGQLVKTGADGGDLLFEYDLVGRVVAEVQNGHRVELTYDIAGNMVRRHLEFARTGPVIFTYDKRRRLVAVEDSIGTRLQKEYDAADLLVLCRRGSIVERFEYDERRCVRRQEVTDGVGREIIVRTYEYDAENNLMGTTDSMRGRRDYHYDATEQLVRVVDSTRGEIEHGYDECGNLIRTGESQTLRYGNGNRLIQDSGAQYERDKSGMLIKTSADEKVTEYEWDGLGQLIAVVHADASRTTYGYDGCGRRVFKDHNGRRTEFFWLGNDLLCERSGDDVTDYLMEWFATSLVWHNGRALHAIVSPEAVPMELIDDDGELVWWGEYDAWGQLIAESSDTVTNRLRLPGQYWDEETGLSYNRFRYYDARNGQFISPDPARFLSQLNEFAYAPNPVNFSDPLGLVCDKFGLQRNSVYVLTKGQPPKIVYVGITKRCPRQRMLEHSGVKDFDSMTVIATDLDYRGSRDIEGSALHHIGTESIADATSGDSLTLQNRTRNDNQYYHSYPDPAGGSRTLLGADQTVDHLNRDLGTIPNAS